MQGQIYKINSTIQLSVYRPVLGIYQVIYDVHNLKLRMILYYKGQRIQILTSNYVKNMIQI